LKEPKSEKCRVIPINIAMIRSLKALLKALKDRPWDGPTVFNAILIDRKDFMKMVKIPNPPNPIYRVPVMPKMDIVITSEDLSKPAVHIVKFMFYRKVGDTLEYREMQ